MTAAGEGNNKIAASKAAHQKITRPQTGDEYLASLRDDRTVFIYGERVEDVTTHPAFRNTARMVARLYDALHDPKHADQIMVPTDTGNGGKTHAFFKAPKTMDDLLAGRNAIAEWAKITYGWLGRSPDYKAAFLAHRPRWAARSITRCRAGSTRMTRYLFSTRYWCLGRTSSSMATWIAPIISSAHRLPAAIRRPRLHPARGQARLHRRLAAQSGRPRWFLDPRPAAQRNRHRHGLRPGRQGGQHARLRRSRSARRQHLHG